MCVLAECSRQFTGNSDFISADPTYFTLMPPDELNIYREGAAVDFFSSASRIRASSCYLSNRIGSRFPNYLLMLNNNC